MGCDIHQSIFVWSLVTNSYVSIGELIEGSWMAENYSIVGNRYYDLFGAFGNTMRSSYPMMTTLHEGIPKHLLPKTTIACLDKILDYHTFTWATLLELKHGISQYIEKLDDPPKFLLDDPENFSEDMLEFPEWNEMNTNLKDAFTKMRIHLGAVEEYLQTLKVIVDPSKTLFMFYFDN